MLRHCDGRQDAQGIVKALQARFPDAELADDVNDFLEVAYDKGWICAK
ncbi:MAG: PqqD family peptide modification chaperone [Candidatus Competibacteraceae bacterium]|nr:PqqD family peptide modification chaperone [Candidatus Competibacteraceae bacterium]